MCDCDKEKRATASLQQSASTQMQAQVEKLGKRQLLQDIRVAARKAMSQLPDECEIEKLDPVSRRYLERVSYLIESGLGSSKWDDAEIARFAGEIAWARLSADIVVTAMQRVKGGGGGGGVTCATGCMNEYDKCIEKLECDTDGWICLCCVPCNLEYMVCMAKCVGSIGGIGIAMA